jgi:hypothetical protein
MPLIRWNTLAWPWHFVDDTPSLAASSLGQNQAAPLDTTPDTPQAFGHDAIWLAVRSPSTQAVTQALQLGQTAPANWRTGLQAVHQPLPCTPGLVFVTPPIQGWVLVTGDLPYPGGTSDSDGASWLLQVLSERFSQVQYFGAHSGIAWHGYARYAEGELVRAFACVDSVDHRIWDVGSNHEEQMLADPFAASVTNGSESDDVTWHQHRVFEMAARWSVNPQQLSAMALPPSLGLVGFLDTGRMNANRMSRDATEHAALGWPRQPANE